MKTRKLDQPKTFYTGERKPWRTWLSDHFETDKEIWFVFPMKEAHEPSLSYNDAVEEALCFGWIDSTIKHLDPTHRIQRFSPRQPYSTYSRANIERLIWLDKQGMIHPKVRASVIDLIQAPYEFPDDILEVIKGDKEAYKNYQKLPVAYNRIRIAYIDSARHRPLEFQKRLEHFLRKTKENKRIKGFGGIDKYYEKEL